MSFGGVDLAPHVQIFHVPAGGEGGGCVAVGTLPGEEGEAAELSSLVWLYAAAFTVQRHPVTSAALNAPILNPPHAAPPPDRLINQLCIILQMRAAA